MDLSSFTLSPYLTQLYITTLTQTYAFLPRLIGAILVLLFGSILARWLKGLVQKSLEVLRISQAIKNTPVDEFFKHASLGRLESVVGSIIYWLFMLLVFQTVASILGLESLAVLLERVVAYIPRIVSAVMILFFGMLVAGLLESLVKGSIRSIQGQHSRLLGKVASYLTISLFILIAVSELGIAQQFILILFIGLVATLTLSLGLSVGLGGKQVMGKIIEEWYHSMKRDINE